LIIVMLDHFLVDSDIHIRRPILFLDWLLTLVFVGGIRAFWRLIREEFKPLFYGEQARKALIIGADPSSEALARYLMADNRLKYRIVGFLDSDPSRHGSLLSGVPVLGDWRKAPYYAEVTGAQELLVVSDFLSGKELRVLMDGCRQEGLHLKVMPALDELLEGNYGFQIRDVEINDLLRRDPVVLNNEAIRSLLEGQTVMITGAGGSIGAEICRQVLRFHPTALVLVEQAENSLFYIEQELRRLNTATELYPRIADITDLSRIEQVFQMHRPRIVFHAAAHKHVPMMEFNPGEAIKNNIVGTRVLADAASEAGVAKFVMISTDKAVNPTSIMGCSKRVAEMYVQQLASHTASHTEFVTVRFGNVLGSSGSVVPIFKEQIARGGPVTVTHPDMTRYFMTIPEAVQLVLQAVVMGKGGEVFVLDMGEPVRIVDLAKDLIRLSGLRLGSDIEIRFTGMRAGEKLFEELSRNDENLRATTHEKVLRARLGAPSQGLFATVDSMLDAAEGHASDEELRSRIAELVPEYVALGTTVTVRRKELSLVA
jgi:FlaA1/EpsC-like NDP-sugar epimerase